eukprot:6119410-Amphidinium_carterae.2
MVLRELLSRAECYSSGAKETYCPTPYDLPSLGCVAEAPHQCLASLMHKINLSELKGCAFELREAFRTVKRILESSGMRLNKPSASLWLALTLAVLNVEEPGNAWELMSSYAWELMSSSPRERWKYPFGGCGLLCCDN